MCDSFLRYGCFQAAALRRTGLNVTLYYVDRVDEFGGSAADRELFLKHAEGSGVAIVALPRRRMKSLLSHTLWLHRDIRRRKIASAIVHSHVDPRYGTLGLGMDVAMVIHDPQTHSGDTPSTFPLPVRLLSRLVELTSSCLIVHSDLLFDQVGPVLRKMPVGVVPHGADVAVTATPVPGKRRLLIFGRLFAYKGVDTALEAFEALPEEMSDVVLIVAGRGPFANQARGRPNVYVREEYISDADVDVLLESVRLVLLPYKDATQSGVGSLAIARGVPCIVTRAGSLSELVPDSSPGLIVRPNEPEKLAAAIVENIDHDESLRRAVRDHAAAHFAWPVVAQRWCDELRRLGLEAGKVPVSARAVGRS
jgi:glycosyltransferase involved in cell wall biosynthesis